MGYKNWWKKLKGWQKGLFVGFVFAILSLPLINIFLNCSGSFKNMPLKCFLLLFIFAPAIKMGSNFPYIWQSLGIYSFAFIEFFIIGFVVGLIINKNKKQ